MMLNAFSSKTRFVIRYALGCWASLWRLARDGGVSRKTDHRDRTLRGRGRQQRLRAYFPAGDSRKQPLAPPHRREERIGSRRNDRKPHSPRGRADGHTILCLHDGIYTAQHYGNADWGPSDFEPLAATGRSEGDAVRGKARSILSLSSWRKPSKVPTNWFSEPTWEPPTTTRSVSPKRQTRRQVPLHSNRRRSQATGSAQGRAYRSYGLFHCRIRTIQGGRHQGSCRT